MSIDLLEELHAISARARETRERVETGEAKNGIAGLVAIEKRAEDAIRHATDLQDEAAALAGQSRQLVRKRRSDRATRS